jgi:hypothetical protein
MTLLDLSPADFRRFLTVLVDRRLMGSQCCLAMSPDLNPIEHIWDMLGRRILAREPPVHSSVGSSIASGMAAAITTEHPTSKWRDETQG